MPDKNHHPTSRFTSNSTIEFPYYDLDAGVKIVNAIQNSAGSKCKVNQLAENLGYSSNGGYFRMLVKSAKTFGLIVREGVGMVKITERGQKILDPDLRAQALSDSFLNVKLYKKIYQKYESCELPTAENLEKAIVSFGVTPKSKVAARQAFEKSAEQAGFLDDNNKLINPFIESPESELDTMSEVHRSDQLNDRSEAIEDTKIHPLIKVLIRELPKPKSEWSSSQKVRWLRAMNSNLAWIYPDSGDVNIKIVED